MSVRGRQMIIATIVLPGTVLVFVPGALLWLYGVDTLEVETWGIWLGKALIPFGIALAVWTSTLFLTEGKGTPAPWHPPQKFVVTGPYQYVRNPMIISVLVLLASEALLFQSQAIAIWDVTFFVVNTVYFKFKEEPGLKVRFGDEYALYLLHVRRWIPRLSAWKSPG